MKKPYPLKINIGKSFANHGTKNREILFAMRNTQLRISSCATRRSNTVVEGKRNARACQRPPQQRLTRARFPCQIIRRARPHPRSLPLGPFVAQTRKVRLRESESESESDGRLENLERVSFVPPTIFHSGYHIVYEYTRISL